MTDAVIDPRPLPTDDPIVIADDLRPAVAGRPGRGGLWLTIGGAVLLGLLVFLVVRRKPEGPVRVRPSAATATGSPCEIHA